MLKQLPAAGFIERIRNPGDERQVFVELTERGKPPEDPRLLRRPHGFR